MKQKLLFTSLMAFLMLISVRGWGQTTYSHTIGAKTWSSYGTETLTGVDWTAAATGGGYWGYDGTKGQQFGSGSSPAKPLTLTTSDFIGTISTIKVSTSGASSVNGTLTVSVNGTTYSPASVDLTSSNTEYTFTGTESGPILLTWNQTSSKALYLKTLQVTYTIGNVAPTLSTQAPASITTTTATGNGNITSTGGVDPTTRGFCWDLSTNADPDINDNKVDETGTFGTGAFTGSISGLTSGTEYKIRAFATNTEGTSYGDVVTFTTLSPKPTNHPTAFAATANSSSAITTSWTDAAPGDQAPSGYLILASTTNSFTDPVDGTAQADDEDLSDNIGVKNLTHGSGGSYQWVTGLSASTQYFYKIFSYNGSGTSINYKTDGTAETANATTYAPLAAPTATAATGTNTTSFEANWNTVSGATSYRLDVSEYETFVESGANATDLFISEYIEGSSNNKYIEIYNGTGASVDLSDYKLQLYANGVSSPTNDNSLSGTLENGAVKVYQNSSASLTLPSGVTAEANTANNFNGNDAVALYKISTSSFVDIFGVIGSDPGSSWFIDPNITVDKTLVRKSNVTEGITTNPGGTGEAAFTTLLSEWDMYDIDDVSHLGSHTFSGGSTPSFIPGYENQTINAITETVTQLTPNKTYYYRVRATDGSSTSDNSNTITVTTVAATSTGFSGAGDWTEVARWSDGIPGSSTNVTIYGAATLSSSAPCKDITIQDGGSLVGTENLTINGIFTMQRNIANDNGWHLLSSTVDGQTIVGSDFVPAVSGGVLATNFDFYSYEESNATTPWINIRKEDFGVNESFETDFIKGKGYLVAYSNTYGKTSFNYTGTVNTGTIVTPALSYSTATDNNKGANLLGNPYPSAIDWTIADKNQFEDNYAYIYNEAKTGGPGYENITGAIAPNQGFFVILKSASNGQTFSFTPSIQAHGVSFMKEAAANAVAKLRFGNQTNYDEISLILNSESGFERDRNDALKFFSFDSQMPQVYAKTSDNVNVAINSIPEINETAVIPVEIYVPAEGSYYISLSENTGVFSEHTILLKDQLSGLQYDLTKVESYSFVASPSDSPDRFLLHFGAVGIGEQDQPATLNAYVFDNRLYVNNSLEKAQLAIYDLQGRLVVQQAINEAGLQSLPLDLPAGIYVLQLSNTREAQSVKINVQ
jgi:hypothetical protein